MPYTFTWVGGYGTVDPLFGYDARDARNWVTDKPVPPPYPPGWPIWTPGPGDDVVFTGSKAPNCNMTSPLMQAEFKSDSIGGGYSAAV